MGEQLIESMATEWDPAEFTDTYRKDLLKLIQRRARSGGRKSPVETTGTSGKGGDQGD
jgi:non-homologous end joining protein Ku